MAYCGPFSLVRSHFMIGGQIPFRCLDVELGIWVVSSHREYVPCCHTIAIPINRFADRTDFLMMEEIDSRFLLI